MKHRVPLLLAPIFLAMTIAGCDGGSEPVPTVPPEVPARINKGNALDVSALAVIAERRLFNDQQQLSTGVMDMVASYKGAASYPCTKGGTLQLVVDSEGYRFTAINCETAGVTMVSGDIVLNPLAGNGAVLATQIVYQGMRYRIAGETETETVNGKVLSVPGAGRIQMTGRLEFTRNLKLDAYSKIEASFPAEGDAGLASFKAQLDSHRFPTPLTVSYGSTAGPLGFDWTAQASDGSKARLGRRADGNYELQTLRDFTLIDSATLTVAQLQAALARTQ